MLSLLSFAKYDGNMECIFSKVSKDFSQKVMKRLSLGETFHKNTSTNNYLNAAASIFFAVVTAYVLFSIELTETNVVSVDTIENTKLNNKDTKAILKAHEKMMTEREQREGSRYGSKKPY